jgi:ubiquinone/menaquinone biosynthesis C-methylase UbiE
MSKDLFSKQASSYAKYRPTYPQELFKEILSFVSKRGLAWDCATGNGQAARALAPYFEKVYATDLSQEQIQQALADPKIEYSVAPAEQTPFADHSFDLITVAQAYHWFDFAAFEREVRRVAKPGAVIAIWCYGLAVCEDPAVDALFKDFYANKMGPYWDKERRYVEEDYATIPFAYDDIHIKNFNIGSSWSREDLLGFLSTWSSVQHYIRAHQNNPVEEFAKQLQLLWPESAAKHFDTPIILRIGKIH